MQESTKAILRLLGKVFIWVVALPIALMVAVCLKLVKES